MSQITQAPVFKADGPVWTHHSNPPGWPLIALIVIDQGPDTDEGDLRFSVASSTYTWDGKRFISDEDGQPLLEEVYWWTEAITVADELAWCIESYEAGLKTAPNAEPQR